MVTKEKKIAKKLYESYLEEKKQELLSREYKEFIKRRHKTVTIYERLARLAGKIIKLKVPKDQEEEVNAIFESMGYDVTAEDAQALAILSPIVLFVVGIFTFLFSSMLAIGIFALAAFSYYYLNSYPQRLSKIRMSKAFSEVILSILYIVIYMKNVPNLEAAITFAAENLSGPLGDDFRKMIWDVSAKRYKDIQAALDKYIATWKEYNEPFVDSIYLIETSLYQKDESKRISLLDKALDRILDGTYEMMVHYVNGLRTPVSAIFMLGITLPIMGLVILPVIGAFLANLITPAALFTFYDIILPIVIIILIQQVLATRPNPFPELDLSNHPLVPPPGKFYLFGKAFPAYIPAVIVFVALSIPFVFYLLSGGGSVSNPSENDVLYSLFFILAISYSLATYFWLTTNVQMKIRKKVKAVENDFAYALFQLGNRISEGDPPEDALLKTAAVMKKSSIYSFIQIIAFNMVKLGMSLRYAIFDEKHGAVRLYPSSLIKSVMYVFLESAKRSQKIAAASLMHTAKYLQSVHLIEEKIRDVLSETISSLRFQTTFIAPLISGIVVGLTSMIIIILSVLGEKIGSISSLGGANPAAGLSSAMTFGFFQMSNAIPLMHFQIIIGIYLIEVVLMSAALLSKIEAGDDKINLKYTSSFYLTIAIIIYFFVALSVTVAFSSMAKIAISLGEFA